METYLFSGWFQQSRIVCSYYTTEFSRRKTVVRYDHEYKNGTVWRSQRSVHQLLV